MLFKIIKYIKSIIHLVLLKIRYGNRLQFKCSGIRTVYIGKGVSIKINKGYKLVLGKNVYINDYCRLECVSGDIYIGNNTYFNTNNIIVSLEQISIGSDCLFGPNIGIFDHNHRYNQKDILIREQGFTKGKIYIGNNVWIGNNCTITSNVNIESNVIVAANSVITKGLSSNYLYGGVPAKEISII